MPHTSSNEQEELDKVFGDEQATYVVFSTSLLPFKVGKLRGDSDSILVDLKAEDGTWVQMSHPATFTRWWHRTSV